MESGIHVFVVSLVLLFVTSNQPAWSYDREFNQKFKYKQSQHRFKMKEMKRKHEQRRAEFKKRREASSSSRRSSRSSRSSFSGSSFRSPDTTLKASDLPYVPLYVSGSAHCTSKGSRKSGSTITHYAKFWTRDSTTKVYQFYVAGLQRNGWKFFKSSTASNIKAKLPSRKMVVSVKYVPLPKPYRGTAVAVGHSYNKSRAPGGIVNMVSPDLSRSGLERWWSGR